MLSTCWWCWAQTADYAMLLDRDHSIGSTDFIGMNFGYAA
jgi:hypothetical protein